MSDRSKGSASSEAEGAGAFGGFIGPRTLMGQVRTTAPWLFDGSSDRFAAPPETAGDRLSDHADHPLGWWSILRHADAIVAKTTPARRDWADYFSLCLAAHFATVMTFVPTDVDTKIRYHLWRQDIPEEELDRMRRLALGLARWDIRSVSARVVHVGDDRVSGHDGERLSVLGGALARHAALGHSTGAAELEAAIDDELAREAGLFRAVIADRRRSLDVLRLAAILTHNAGDVAQGLGDEPAADRFRERFCELATARADRYGGAFAKAATLYRTTLAAEGHRNYPLREIEPLRTSPDLLLPIAPFLDEWGAMLARWPKWRAADRARVVAGIFQGCRRVAGQVGYFRALAGFDSAYPGGLQARELMNEYPSATRKDLKDAAIRKQLAIRRESFESSLGKRVAAS